MAEALYDECCSMKYAALLAALFCGTLHAQALPADVEARNLAATCSACHGTLGHSAGGIPSLAGRDRAELLRLLMDFKYDRRKGTVMNYHARGYSDQQLKLLAGYFAAQKTEKQP